MTTLIAETGHQLRAPLAAMIATIDQLLRDEDLDPALREHIAELGLDAETLYTLAGEMELAAREPESIASEA